MNKAKSNILITYKQPLADGTNTQDIDLDIEKKEVVDALKNILGEKSYIKIVDIYDNVHFILTSNIGYLMVTEV